MSSEIAVGFSESLDSITAAREAAAQAKKQLNHDRIDFALILHTSHYDPKLFLPPLYETLMQTRIIGSSTAGIILTDRVALRGFLIILFYSDVSKFEADHVSHLNLQTKIEAGRLLAKNTVTDFGNQYRKFLLFFIDGLCPDITDFINGVKEYLGDAFPIIGAGSSDNFLFQKTHQYFNNKFMLSGACAVIFGGQMKVGISTQHGWNPLGKPRIATATQGAILKTIDGQPAMNLYKSYFGDEADTLQERCMGHINIRYPLGIRTPKKHEYLLRNVLSILDDGSIVCQDKIAPGAEVHIMIGNKDSCLQAADTAAREAKEQLKGAEPRLIFIIESLMRYKLLGSRTAMEEIRHIRRILGEQCPVVGMYSFGEIATYRPADGGAQTHLQNNSITVLAIS